MATRGKTRLPKVAIAILAIACGWGASYAGAQEPVEPVRISAKTLVSSPDAYRGKLVAVEGILSLGFEADWLHPVEESASSDEVLWVDVDRDERRRFKKHRQKHVIVYGVFDHSDCNGHLCLFAGDIDVVDIVRVPKRR